MDSETTPRARRRASTFRRFGWIVIAAMTTLAIAGPAAGPVLATGQSVAICHGTNSDTNQYIAESPAINSNGAFAGQLSGGHNTHTGPVWYPGAKAAQVAWGDIIPPYDYAPTSFHYPGLNWTVEGQAIWNAGCAATPALGIDKAVAETSFNVAGAVLHYTIVATNTGTITLHGVTVVDAKLGTLACTPTQPATLVPGATISCTGSYTTTQADLDAGKVDNTATADSNETSPVSDSATVPAVQSPALALDKTASPASYSAVGQVIDYSYKLTNSGNVTLSGPFTVVDDKAAVICPATAKLAVGHFITCQASYTITQADLNAGSVTNHATGHAFFGANVVDSNQDDATVTATESQALALVKTASPKTYDHVGQVIGYSYLVTNTGNVSLEGPVTIADDKSTDEACPAVSTVGNGDGFLDPGESITCTASYTITQADLEAGFVTNVATASADEATSNQDSETVTAIQVQPQSATLVIHKILDLDSSAAEDLVDGPDWAFAVAGGAVDTGVTNAAGLLPFTFDNVDGSITVDVSETIPLDKGKPLFTLVRASCVVTPSVDEVQAEVVDARGTADLPGAAVNDIVINAGETVTCTFTNESGGEKGVVETPKPTPPPTSTLPVSGTPGGDTWRLLILGIAALLAMVLFLTPALPARARRRR